MKTRFVRYSLAVTALALAGALSGCFALGGTTGDPDAKPPLPFDLVKLPEDQAPAVKPGQSVELGEVVLLPVTDARGEPDDPIETVVLGVAEGKKSFWNTFQNSEEFSDETPFFAVVQHRFVTGEVSSSSTPFLLPVLDDGSHGNLIRRQMSAAANSNNACPFEVPRFDLDKNRGPKEYIECIVFAAPEGSSVAAIEWRDINSFTMWEPDPKVKPFWAKPVVWKVKPVAASGD